MNEKSVDTQFLSLIMMLASGAWQHMGKMPDQMSGKVAQDMAHAKMFIDILRMIKEKTKGNLSPDEEKMIANTVSDLELNYVDEISKSYPAVEMLKTETASAGTQSAAQK